MAILRSLAQRRRAALALSLAAALSSALLGCNQFDQIGEGEYNFNKDGPTDYYCDGFEKNDGASSTAHFFKRIGRDEHHLPSVSQTWASEGSWSMRIPLKGELYFTFSPKESGTLSLKYASASSRTFVCWIQNTPNGPSSSQHVTTQDGFKTGEMSVQISPGTNSFSICQTDGTIYIDEITFKPTLIGSTPSDDSVVTESPKLDWADSDNGAPYRLQISYSDDFSSPFFEAAGIQESEYSPSGLTSGKCYYWRVLTANAAPTGEWSSPFSFMFAGPASDDSFETDLRGSGARNAWSARGATVPEIVDSDASDGSHSLKLVQTDTITGDVTVETAVTLDSPKVLRYSYKVESAVESDSSPTFLRFERYFLYNGSWETRSDYPMSHTGGAWAQAVELIPAGTHRIRWYFRRTAANKSPGSYALLDDLRFEDPQPFEDEDFETLDASGRTKQAWGFQGWFASGLKEGGGIGGGRGMQLSASGKKTNEWDIQNSAVTLIADTGTEPVILSCKTYGNMDNIGSSESSLPSLPGIYCGSGWGQRFYSITGTGAQSLQLWSKFTDQPLILDDFRMIPYTPLSDSGLSEDFESGVLGGQYYNDELFPPALETANPHSGAYCLKLGKNAGKNSSFISFPLSTRKALTVSMWLRAEGTAVGNDSVSVARSSYAIWTYTQIPSTWTKYTVRIAQNYTVAYPLTLSFNYVSDQGLAIYIDDITITPCD